MEAFRARQAPCPPVPVDGYGTSDTITVTFSRPVGSLVILRDGVHSCYDTEVSQVIAYAADSTEQGRAPFRVIPTCSDAMPTLRDASEAARRSTSTPASAVFTTPYAAFSEADLSLSQGVTRIKIAPPQEWQFTFTDPYFGDTSTYTRYGTYHLIFRPEPDQPLPDVLELAMIGGDSMPPSGTRVTNLAPVQRAVEVRVRTAAGVPVAGTNAPTATVVTGGDGRVRATYVASEVGGTEVIRATAAGLDSVQRRLILTVPRVVSVPDTAVHYFMQPTRNHSPAHNYAHAGVMEKLVTLLARYKALGAADPARYPFDGDNSGRFRITAAGLPRGGLYDVNGRWTPIPDGHQWHREGLEVDVNDRVNGQGAESVDGRGEMLRPCRTDEIALQLRPRKCIYHAGHFHITYPGVFP